MIKYIDKHKNNGKYALNALYPYTFIGNIYFNLSNVTIFIRFVTYNNYCKD